ncbi:MAG: TonB-dependent receptor [Calditrichaeota bacterium]|nr:TonB-dependent receptor [Calditrichota bacterium]
MSNAMYKKYSSSLIGLIFILLTLIPLFVRAQSSPKGKIMGQVIDARTGEPLPGANIMIEGTTLGAASDLEGYYYILNAPTGKITLVCQMIGYQTVRKTQVEVVIDRTTRVDFKMKEAIEETAPVVVVAEKPSVVRDLTATANFMDAKEIETAPIQGLREMMQLNANVTRNPNGTFSIRGGGAFDVQVQLNGIEQITSNSGVPGYNFMGEKSNTSWKYDYNPLGVQQMEVISGGFSAEYGNAQSGIVKVVTKEGGQEFHGEFRTEIRPPGKYHYGPYLYGPETVEWKNWGSFDKWKQWRDINAPDIPDDSLYNSYYQKWIANHSPGKGNRSNPLGVYDYRKLTYQRYLFGLGGPLSKDGKLRFFLSAEYRNTPARIPSVERSQVYQNYGLNITYQATNADKLKFMVQYQGYRGSVWSGSNDIRWASIIGQWPQYKYVLIFDSPKEETTTTQSLTWTHVFSNQTFLEALVWHQRELYVERNRSIITATDPWLIKAGPWDEEFRRIVYAFTSLYALDNKTDVWNATVDLTSQVTNRHLVKIGAKAQYWDTRYNGESGARLNAFISYSGFAEYYHAFPYYFALYAQDKIEVEDIVANIGVRFEGFNMNTGAPADRFAPFYYGTGQGGGPFIGDPGNPQTKKPETHVAVSPRFGLSFPIGENAAFRLQYGHFYSMPLFRQSISRSTWQGWRMYGNPNLGFKKTISYEIGLQKGIGGHRLDIAAYYNDRVHQTVRVNIHSPQGSQQIAPQNPYYISYENNGYGASKGIELSLNRVAPGNWNYRFSYSFSRTTFGAYGAIDIYPDPNDPRSFLERRSANDFVTMEDRTHSFRALISYLVPQNFIKKIQGFTGIYSANVSMIYSAKSGTPFTYVTSYDQFTDVINNRRYPLEQKTDINITLKTEVFGVKPMLSVRIDNLFNNKWLTPLIDATELRNWVEYGITRDTPPSDDPNDPQARIYKLRYYQTYRNMPTAIYFSLGVSF